MTTPLNHSSTGSELASVNNLSSLPPRGLLCITLIFTKRYEINVLLSPVLLSRSLHRRLFTLESFLGLSREKSIMVRGHVGYTKIVCLLEKPAGSSRCRYPTCTVDYIIVVTRSSQIDVKIDSLSFSLSTSRTRESRDSCTLNVNLSRAFFTLFNRGDYSVHA